MVLAIVRKELRETRIFAAGALLLYAIYVSKLTGHWNHLLTQLLGWLPGLGGPVPPFPFVQNGFAMIYGFIAFVLAIALGFRQSVGEGIQGTYAYLLHRPMTRRAIILTKMLSGAFVLLGCTSLPILIYAAWAAAPGTHPAPFAWSMTGPVVQLLLTMPLFYLGAFASGIRPARWFGSRLLPLVAIVMPACSLPYCPRWWLVGLPLLLILEAMMISNILLEAERRDF